MASKHIWNIESVNAFFIGPLVSYPPYSSCGITFISPSLQGYCRYVVNNIPQFYLLQLVSVGAAVHVGLMANCTSAQECRVVCPAGSSHQVHLFTALFRQRWCASWWGNQTTGNRCERKTKRCLTHRLCGHPRLEWMCLKSNSDRIEIWRDPSKRRTGRTPRLTFVLLSSAVIAIVTTKLLNSL